MKSEKKKNKLHKNGHMGDCFGVGPPVCDKKKSILVGSPLMKISGSGHVECSMPEFK